MAFSLNSTWHSKLAIYSKIWIYKVSSYVISSADEKVPTIIMSDTHKTVEIIYNSRNLVLNMIYVSFTLLNRVANHRNCLPNWL